MPKPTGGPCQLGDCLASRNGRRRATAVNHGAAQALSAGCGGAMHEDDPGGGAFEDSLLKALADGGIDRKQIRLDLIRAERRLELATAAADLGIWEWMIDTGEFFYSPRGRAIYGFAPDEVINFERLKDRTHPEDFKRIDPLLQSALDPKIRAKGLYRYRITRADTGEERWLLAHGEAVFSGADEDASALSYTGTLEDITDEVRLEEELRDEQARLRMALGAGELAVWELNLQTNIVTSSKELNRLYRFPDDYRPQLAELQALYAPGERERVEVETSEKLAHGETSVNVEVKHVWPDGVTKWISVRAQIIFNDRATPDRVIGVAMDNTERHLAEERLVTTARELQHRVKNSLTIVQAIASQSLRSARTKEEGIVTFSGRLQAMAAATELMTRGDWQTVQVRDIVAEITSPYLDDSGRNFEISGDTGAVDSRHAVSLGMALHELCTNAVKYGALSTQAGVIHLTWKTSAEGVLLEWREQGGPPVAPLAREGFGTQLLRRLFGGTQGSVELQFLPSGLVCRISIPPSLD
jgi:PAS domain S-box-containing protein